MKPLTEPAEELIRVIREFGVGNFQARPDMPERLDAVVAAAIAPALCELGARLDRGARNEFIQREEVLQREQLLLSFIEHLPIGVFVFDTAGTPFYSNATAIGLLGTAVIPDGPPGKMNTVFRVGVQETFPIVEHLFLPALVGEWSRPVEVEVEVCESRVPVQLTSAPVRDSAGVVRFGLLTLQDISEQRDMENRIRRSQGLESIGRLAGGVAHDFNNLLTVIFSFGHFVLEALKDDDTRADMQEVLDAATRAQALVRQLLAFSRKQSIEPKVMNLNECVDRMEKMLKRIVGDDVELGEFLGDELGSVLIDPGAVEQVIVNLVVNARDALPDNGGKVTLETANVSLEAQSVNEEFDIPAGRYVLLAVSDNGAGMDEETQRHIFEPFYTTKQPGEGTGLGLATCYGIIKQAQGFILVYSELGRGTSFKIYLPRIDDPPAAAEFQNTQGVRRGDETVLIIDDDDQIRASARRILEARGYSVLDAAVADDALRIAQKRRSAIDLVVCDVVLPGTAGPELVERLRRITPDLRVLFMSGFAEAAMAKNGLLKDGVELVTKPFTPDVFSRRVREVLDGAAPRARAPSRRVLVIAQDMRLLVALRPGLPDGYELEIADNIDQAREHCVIGPPEVIVCAPSVLPEMSQLCPSASYVVLAAEVLRLPNTSPALRTTPVRVPVEVPALRAALRSATVQVERT